MKERYLMIIVLLLLLTACSNSIEQNADYKLIQNENEVLRHSNAQLNIKIKELEQSLEVSIKELADKESNEISIIPINNYLIRV